MNNQPKSLQEIIKQRQNWTDITDIKQLRPGRRLVIKRELKSYVGTVLEDDEPMWGDRMEDHYHVRIKLENDVSPYDRDRDIWTIAAGHLLAHHTVKCTN